MAKQLQNKIAGSKLALPVMLGYATIVWLLSGMRGGQWRIQATCFVVSVLLMVLLNNVHALIRIYSRMVSCSFIALSCCASFLFPSMYGAFLQPFFIGGVLLLFLAYQDKESAGYTYYAFVCFGIATMTWPPLLYAIPLLWLLMALELLCLSWRTWGASLLGLLTPYWFLGFWLLYTENAQPIADFAERLTDIQLPFALHLLTGIQTLVFAYVVMLTIVGIVHYIRKRHDDKIRIRQLFGFLIWFDLALILFLVVQPQHYDALLRLIIVCTAPLLGHFVALTKTRMTNVAFCCLVAITLIITAYSIWTL